jgi:hypothetical protein
MHQHQFSNQDNSDINNIWGISEWVNHISDEKLKWYVCKIPEWINIIGFSTEAKSIICLKSEWEKQVMYALCRKPDWTTRLLNTLELRKLNQVIEQNNISESLVKLILPVQYKQSINSSINKQKNKFSDGKYTYTSNRWQKFDVKIENKQATEIKPHGSILLWSNVWAIKRCITLWFDKNFQKYWELENKFEEFIPVQSTQLSVVDETNKILTWEYLWKEPNISNIDNWDYYENIRQKITDSSNLILSTDYIEDIYSQVEDFTISNFPSIKHIEAAENFILIIYKRTWVDKSTISDLLQTGPTIHYMFDNIDESIKNEWYDINFVQVLLQLSEIIKNIFLSMVSEEKRAYH